MFRPGEDEAAQDIILADVAIQDELQTSPESSEESINDVRAVWLQMSNDLRSGGPLAAMMLSLRASAIEAMKELAFTDSTDATKIAFLQAEVRRHIKSVNLIAGYRNEAENIDMATIPQGDANFLTEQEYGD